MEKIIGLAFQKGRTHMLVEYVKEEALEVRKRLQGRITIEVKPRIYKPKIERRK